MPDIKFACPSCKVTLKVSDALAGKKIKCPKCAAVAPIPAVSAVGAVPHPPAPSKPAVALAKPVAVPPPIARKPAAPPPPPMAPLAPPLDLSDLEGDSPNELEEANERPSPRSRKPLTPRKSGSLLSLLALILAFLYLVGFVLVYFGLLLPIPEALKVP